ncbi:hypothetical conserved protein [Candidatus Nitrosoglobus terrae]|uniref:Hypothetical conserved protein n=2 Tax=Candidatus Nitrosoglobus terrae TaxID=1630141 RepID=A0A1Q2SNA1_9GAMM|nr:hypothetical conserved protein [Candidatus Nitrosoglobus terrae]
MITGPYHDPSNYTAGWTSGAYAKVGDGRNCIIFLFGNATAGTPNNSVRCFDSSSNTFSYLQQANEGSGPTFAITGNGINDRDNHLSLSIPGRGLVILGGAYLNGKPNQNGFFDYASLQWVDINTVMGGLFKAPAGFNWSAFNPAMVWSEDQNMGFVYGGAFNGSPSKFITLIHPQSDGTYSLEPVNGVANTDACENMRNSAVAAGQWVYIVGGVCNEGGVLVDSKKFRRFNLVTRQWDVSLPNLPVSRSYPQVTYDQGTGDIVVYGGNPTTLGSNANWTGTNSVFTWNIHNQGPAWVDITAQANMPAVRMPFGAYDPTTEKHCYRGGAYFDSNGNIISGGYSSSNTWCLQLAGNVSGGSSGSVPPTSPPVNPDPPPPPVTPPVSPPVTPPPSSSGGSGSSSTDSQIQALQKQLNILLQQYTENYPDVVMTKNELMALLAQKAQQLGVPISGSSSVGSNPTPPPPVTPPVSPPVTPPPSSSGAPAQIISGEIKVTAVPQALPPLKSSLSPYGAAKHMRLTELGDGKLYVVAGDWGGGDYTPFPFGDSVVAQDGRQDLHSYDVLANTWKIEAHYCGNSTGNYPRHPDEVGQLWDTKRQRMWLGPGIWYPYNDTCNQGGGFGILSYFDFISRQWVQPEGLPAEPMKTMQARPRPSAHGIYDAQTDKLIFLDDRSAYYFDPDTQTWATYPHTFGLFADGTVAQVGRYIYITNEASSIMKGFGDVYSLWRWNIDTHTFEEMGLLPDDLRDGNGDDWGRVYMAALGDKIAMYKQMNNGVSGKINQFTYPSSVYVYDAAKDTYQKVVWDDPATTLTDKIKGNTMTWHSSGWMVLFGCVGDAGCDYSHPMTHIGLVDLRQFEGTGENIPNN